MAPETATGAPNPAAPSMNAPKEKAINSACNRRSLVRPPTESLMISNFPVSTARRYSMIELKTIHAIGKRPNAAPSSVDRTAICTGMPYTRMATTNAEPSAVIAAIQAGFRKTPNMMKSTKMGTAAARAERPRLPPRGS